MSTKLRLPRREHMVETGSEDPLKYYFHPVTGRFYLRRLAMALELLGDRKFDALLDIGYGSGISLPELAARSRRLAGIDVHGYVAEVQRMLELEHLQAELVQGDILRLPYADASFDGIVCISVLEHIPELAKAVNETARVLRPGGVAVVGFPAKNRITDAAFRTLGFDFDRNHVSHHPDILRALDGRMRREALLRFPSFLPPSLSLYIAGCWTKP